MPEQGCGHPAGGGVQGAGVVALSAMAEALATAGGARDSAVSAGAPPGQWHLFKKWTPQFPDKTITYANRYVHFSDDHKWTKLRRLSIYLPQHASLHVVQPADGWTPFGGERQMRLGDV